MLKIIEFYIIYVVDMVYMSSQRAQIKALRPLRELLKEFNRLLSKMAPTALLEACLEKEGLWNYY